MALSRRACSAVTTLTASREHKKDNGQLISDGTAVLHELIMDRLPSYKRLLSFQRGEMRLLVYSLEKHHTVTIKSVRAQNTGLAGLAGTFEVFGVHHNVNLEISPGYGYTGIIVALLVDLNPIMAIFAAIFFGGLINGSVTMITSTGVHTSITYVVQAMILISVLFSRALIKYRIRRIQHVE